LGELRTWDFIFYSSAWFLKGGAHNFALMMTNVRCQQQQRTEKIVKRVQLNSIKILFNLRKYFSKNRQFDIYPVQIVNKNFSAFFPFGATCFQLINKI
jgi:hypothetical protein